MSKGFGFQFVQGDGQACFKVPFCILESLYQRLRESMFNIGKPSCKEHFWGAKSAVWCRISLSKEVF